MVGESISVDSEIERLQSKNDSLARLGLEILANSDVYLGLPNDSALSHHNLRVTQVGNADNILTLYIEPDHEGDRFVLKNNENPKPFYKTSSRDYSKRDITFHLKTNSKRSRVTSREIILFIAHELREDSEIIQPITSIIPYSTFGQMQYEAKLPSPSRKKAFLF